MTKTMSYLASRLTLILMILTLLIVWGVYSVSQIKKEYLPNINNPVLMVTLPYGTKPVSTSETTGLNDKLTKALKNVDHLQSIESTAYTKGLFFKLTFPQDGKTEAEQAAVKTALQNISLPPKTGQPQVHRISSDAFPIMKISLMTKDPSEQGTLSTKAKQIIDQLENVPGIEKIQTVGDGDQGFSISLNNKTLKKTGINYKQVIAALRAKHLITPSGVIQLHDLHLPLQITESSVTKENTWEPCDR